MSANWTHPATYSAGQLVTAADLNKTRDNLEYLKDPVTALHTFNQAADYSTTATTFVDVDATHLALTVTTTSTLPGGGDLCIGFSGSAAPAANGGLIFFDVLLDGVRIGGDDGLIALFNAAATVQPLPATFVIWKRGLAAGSHTLRLQWKVSANTGTLYAGAGTANRDLHPQFWVREVS